MFAHYHNEGLLAIFTLRAKLVILKEIILIVVLFALSLTVNAQDLIVTQSNDSILCKIVLVEKDSIHFKLSTFVEDIDRSLPMSNVLSYSEDFFGRPQVPPEEDNKYFIETPKIEEEEKKDPKPIELPDFSRMRFSGVAGFSYLVGFIDPDAPDWYRDYLQDLQTGYHFGGNVDYFINDKVGFGLMARMFRSKNELEFPVTVQIGNQTYTGPLNNEIHINFFAPSFLLRKISRNRKTHLITNLAIGYATYSNTGMQAVPYSLKGSTLGMYGEFGVDLMLYDNFAIGGAIAMTLGSLTSYEETINGVSYTNQSETEILSITRLDLSIGLKYRL